jgi:hypothetical protein
MANRAHSTPAPASRRRLPAPPVAPIRRRGAGLPSHLAHLAPLLANRSRIEALAAALIDLLDSFDAPLADFELDYDGEAETDACQAVDDIGAPVAIPFPVKLRKIAITSRDRGPA